MWPFKKKQWKLIGHADLGWISVLKNGEKLEKTMRVLLYTHSGERKVLPPMPLLYNSCLRASINCFTEAWAWERGGPLPSSFQKITTEYTRDGNVIQLKVKE